MTHVEPSGKITASHLARKAVVYLRQSSIAQVKHNTESQRLQYALKDTATAYGFARIDIIDADLGMSAASGAQAREGFKQLLVEDEPGGVSALLMGRPLGMAIGVMSPGVGMLPALFAAMFGAAENERHKQERAAWSAAIEADHLAAGTIAARADRSRLLHFPRPPKPEGGTIVIPIAEIAGQRCATRCGCPCRRSDNPGSPPCCVGAFVPIVVRSGAASPAQHPVP